MKKIKVTVVTGIHERREQFTMFMNNYKLWTKANSNAFEFTLCIAGDKKERISQDVLKKSKVKHLFTQTPNRPLSNKMNAAFELALQTEHDYVMLTGFDDLFDPDIFKTYHKWLQMGIDYVGCIDCYFYNIETGEGVFFAGYTNYRVGEPVGSGRFFSKRLMRKLNYKPYADGLENGLDRSMTEKMQGMDFSSEMISCKRTPIVGLKGEGNLWDWSHVEHAGDKVQMADFVKYLSGKQAAKRQKMSFCKSKKIDIVVLLPLWGRPEIFEICAKKLQEWIDVKPHDYSVTVLCVLSNEDTAAGELHNIILGTDFMMCVYKNNPLGEKMNAAIRLILNAFVDFDYIMNFGSDDVILPDSWRFVQEAVRKNYVFFGTNGFYCVDKKKKKAIKMQFYDVVAGAGRFIHKSIIEKMNGQLYKDSENAGLDTTSEHNIYFATGEKPEMLNYSEFICDIKSEININDFDIYEFTDLSTKADYEETVKKFNI